MPKSIASLISSKGKSETANMLLLDMYANETSSLNTKCKVDLIFTYLVTGVRITECP